jgi:hypothetical protein
MFEVLSKPLVLEVSSEEKVCLPAKAGVHAVPVLALSCATDYLRRAGAFLTVLTSVASTIGLVVMGCVAKNV